MQLLITTSQSLLLLDTENGHALPLERGRGLYYGIASTADTLYVAARNRPVSSDTERVSERGVILLFDQSLQGCGSIEAPFPLRDLHEIAWHAGRLWATCSHDNMIAVYDGQQWEQWFPLGGTLEGPGDVNHFNSFFFENDKIWIVAHNNGASELLAFSIATRVLTERIDLGHCAHNLWRENDQLFTCSSRDGTLLGNRGFSLETGGFPRGIAFGENFRCVGISAKAERKERDFTTGKVIVYDGNWTLQKEIILQDEGLILDIKILPEGFRCNAALPSIPFQVIEHTPVSTTEDGFYRAYEDRNRGSHELIKSRLKGYRPFIEALIAQDYACKAIDLGCGRGEWLELLSEAGFDASGVDLDEGMLAGCRKRGLKARRIDALQALRELPEGSMGLVSAFHVVEHIPFDDVRTLVREALRVLKPGGLLILETPNPENLVVGASLFYQDPSHLRPVPPELLRFVVEYEGFKRNIVTRFQESPALHTDADINLLHVLEGVSPDYAVIGQKKAEAKLMAQFDSAFRTRYGITLATIAHRYDVQQHKRMTAIAAASNTVSGEQNKDLNDWIAHVEQCLRQANEGLSYLQSRDTYLEQRIEQLEIRLAQAENRAAQNGEHLHAALRSRSSGITAPLRWLVNQLRLLRQHGLVTRLKAASTKADEETQTRNIPAPQTETRPTATAPAPTDTLTSAEVADMDEPVPDNEQVSEAVIAEHELPERANAIYLGLKSAENQPENHREQRKRNS